MTFRLLSLFGLENFLFPVQVNSFGIACNNMILYIHRSSQNLLDTSGILRRRLKTPYFVPIVLGRIKSCIFCILHAFVSKPLLRPRRFWDGLTLVFSVPYMPCLKTIAFLHMEKPNEVTD